MPTAHPVKARYDAALAQFQTQPLTETLATSHWGPREPGVPAHPTWSWAGPGIGGGRLRVVRGVGGSAAVSQVVLVRLGLGF
jgi:hypothetical protein